MLVIAFLSRLCRGRRVCLWAAVALLAAGCRAPRSPAATVPAVSAPATTRPAAEDPTSIPGRIAVLLPDDTPGSRWAATDRPAFERCLTEAGAVFSLYSAGGDPATQAAQAAEAIADGTRVLVLAHVDNDAGAAVLAAARAEGIKVIDYDRLTTGGPGANLYVGFDPLATGRLMGETLAPFIRALPVARRNVVLLVGPAGDGAAQAVGEGIRAVVEPYVASGQWTLLADVAVADTAAAETAMAALLAGDTPVGAVLATDDALAGVAADALRAAGRDPVRLAGRGATVPALRRILAREQTLTAYQPVGPLIEATCQAALAVLSGDEVVSLTTRTIDNGAGPVAFIRLSSIAVTADNLAETVVADGAASWAELCAGAAAAACP